jgi:hypothetical protein
MGVNNPVSSCLYQLYPHHGFYDHDAHGPTTYAGYEN